MQREPPPRLSGRSQSCQSAACSDLAVRQRLWGRPLFASSSCGFSNPSSSPPLQANQPAARPEPAGLCRLLLGGRLAGSHQDGPLPRQLHGGGLRFPGVGGQDVHRVSRRQTRTAASKLPSKPCWVLMETFFFFLFSSLRTLKCNR